MSLIDDDSKKIDEYKDRKNNNSKAGKKNGLSRFKSLNKYKKITEEFRETKENKSSVDDEIISDRKKLPKKSPVKLNLNKQSSKGDSDIEVESANTENTEKNIKSTIGVQPKPKKNIEKTNESTKGNTVGSTKRVHQDTTESTKDESKEYDQSTSRVQNNTFKGANESTNRVLQRVHSDVDIDVRTLSGQNKQLLLILFEDCKKNGSMITGKFTRDDLSSLLNIKGSTVKTLIYRLNKAGYVARHKAKSGRGGWLSLRIPERIYQQLVILDSLNENKWGNNRSEYNRGTEQGTDGGTNLSSSSSTNILSISNTSTKNTNELPNDWLNIEIPNFLISKGFTKTHIKQIYSSQKEALNADQVQESLDHFSYDLENELIKPLKGPIRAFMGVLRSRGEEWISDAVIEAERLQMEKLRKAKQQREELRIRKEEESLSEQCKIIASKLNDKRKKELVAPKKGAFEFESFAYQRLIEAKIKELIEDQGIDYFRNDLKGDEVKDFKNEIINLQR